MKVLINLLKFILLTILTICLISIGIIQIVSTTILDKDYILQKLEETNFYSEIYELVTSNFENYIYQSGLDEEVLQNICTKEKVEQDINQMISNLYDGTNKKIDTTEIKDNLNSNIDKLGIKNKQNEKAIEQFVTHVCNEYTNTLVHTNYENKINSVYKNITQKLDKINIILIAVVIISVLFILIINNKKIIKNIGNIGIVLLASAMFGLIANWIIKTGINIQGIKVLNDAFSNTIVTIIQDVLDKIVTLGLVTLVISLILIVIYAIMSNFAQKKGNI